VEKVEVGDKVDSDHHPVVVEIRGGSIRIERRGEKRTEIKRGWWSEEGRENFRREVGRLRVGENEVHRELEENLAKIRRGLEERKEG
jgi:hypothetical protein